MVFYDNNQGNFPASPIGNQAMASQPLPMIPVGQQQGYSTYNGYFNPWEIQRRQDEQLKNYNNNINTQIDIYKRLYINSCKNLGIYVDEQAVDEYYNQFRPSTTSTYDMLKKQKEIAEEQKIAEAVQNANGQGSMLANAQMKIWYDQEEKNQKIYEGKSLQEQYEALTAAAFDMRMEDAKRQNKNMKYSYNNSAYQKLIASNGQGLFSTNIDDMEVTLPNNLSGSYQSRRARFLAAVLGK